jgi:hypothetical protein
MKKKIAFIKFGGMCSGGTEKHLQTLAVNLPSDKFDVTYFYCDAAPYIGSDYKHSDTDPHRLAYMQNSAIKIVKFDVGAKDVTTQTHDWVDTNFWDVFNEEDFDMIQTGRSGHPEYPFTHINKTAIIDSIHLPDMAEKKANVMKVILVAEEQHQRWNSAGGEPGKAVVIPPAIEIPEVSGDLRKELGIAADTTVYGMHQRADDGIFSQALMPSWQGSNASKMNSCLVILGGSKLYQQHAQYLKLTNVIFLESTGDVSRIHRFLNTLDVYTHARKDGEQCSSSIIEALYHSIPIIGHIAPSMGHKGQIKDAGYICSTFGEYAAAIDALYDLTHRNKLSSIARKRYEETFSLQSVVDLYVGVYNSIN